MLGNMCKEGVTRWWGSSPRMRVIMARCSRLSWVWNNVWPCKLWGVEKRGGTKTYKEDDQLL